MFRRGLTGIHYGPWRPATGPNKHYSFLTIPDVEADFELIRQTGANAVLIYDAPDAVLDLAQQKNLKVVYVFALDWYSGGGADQQGDRARVRIRRSGSLSNRGCTPAPNECDRY